MFCCSVLLMQSCTSDHIEDLGEGYFYRNEGGNLKDILCKKPDGGEIPATVLDYVYDKKFIIAKQKPKLPQDPLYKRIYNYKTNNNLFYWVILKTNNTVIGPLDMQGLENARLKYKIPDNLVLP